jgi:hypothetical protein
VRRGKFAAAVGVVSAFLTGTVFADNSWINTPIQTMIVQDQGTPSHPGIVIVIMPTNQLYTPSCQTTLFTRFVIDLSRPASKAQYAMLLAANVAKQNVTIALNESCLEGYALLRNVELAE